MGWNWGEKYFGELRGAQKLWRFTGGLWKGVFLIFYLKNACWYYGLTTQWGGGQKMFTCSRGGGLWTFLPACNISPLLAVIVDNSISVFIMKTNWYVLYLGQKWLCLWKISNVTCLKKDKHPCIKLKKVSLLTVSIKRVCQLSYIHSKTGKIILYIPIYTNSDKSSSILSTCSWLPSLPHIINEYFISNISFLYCLIL